MPGRRLLILASCAALLPGCSLLAPRFDRPELSVVGVELRGGNLFQQNFRVTLRIHNPNERALPVEGLTAHLAVGGESIANGQTSRGFVVPPNGDAQFDVMVTANMANSIAALTRHLNDRGAPIAYDVTGVIRLDVPLFRTLPFHSSGALTLND